MVRRRWLVTQRGRRKACWKVASPSLRSRAPLEKSQHPARGKAPSPRLSPLDFATVMWEANPVSSRAGRGGPNGRGWWQRGGRGFPGTAPPHPLEAGS